MWREKCKVEDWRISDEGIEAERERVVNGRFWNDGSVATKDKTGKNLVRICQM